LQRRATPAAAWASREAFRSGVGLLAAAILVLELEPQRLARVEPVARAVERWRLLDAQRRRDGRLGLIELHQRLKRRRGIARAGESHARRSGSDFPPRGGRPLVIH